jgi:methionyl-tRNA synthetase
MTTASQPRRRYLLLPMQPTPNGRLHIGHASGPYLRADVCARHLRLDGHDVSIVTGSDVYENWVLLDSHRAGRTAAETCWRFHDLIGDDLRALEIGVDHWICPLDELHDEAYRAVHEELLQALAQNGSARKVRERIPRSQDSGRYLIGVWLLGRCPNCRQSGGGNACEGCGYHYQPSEILEPRSRLDEGPLVWDEVESWFLCQDSIESLVARVHAADVSRAFADIAVRYLRQTGGHVRLSQPGEWGIQSPLAGPGCVLSNPYYVYSLYCGEIYRRRGGDQRSPFHTSSDVITVGLFGIDNAVAGVAASQVVAAAHGQLRPFDHTVTNFFLELEGQKCSTSRKHGIWLGELFARTSVSSDELRYFLSHRSLETASDNFVLDEFVGVTNRLRALMSEVEGVMPEGESLSAGARERIRLTVREQGAHLQPGREMSLAAAVAVLDGWMFSGDAGHRDIEWRTGLALLAEPFMPSFARRIWQGLGRPGGPSLPALETTTPKPLGRPRRLSRRLERRELDVVSHIGSPHA